MAISVSTDHMNLDTKKTSQDGQKQFSISTTVNQV